MLEFRVHDITLVFIGKDKERESGMLTPESLKSVIAASLVGSALEYISCGTATARRRRDDSS